MATESYFRNTFCAEIIAAYSKERFTNARIQAVWGSVKTFSDEALAIALKEVTKPALFPGADKIIEACSTAQGHFKNIEIARAKASGASCLCSGGLRQVNNFAYRCTCKLGSLMYPNFPEYQGQVPFIEKNWIDEDGNHCNETYTHIYINHPTLKGAQHARFVIKEMNQPYTPKATPTNKPRLVKADEFEMDRF